MDRTSLELAWRDAAPPSADTEADTDAEPSQIDALLPPIHQLIAASDPTSDEAGESGLSVIPSYTKDQITIVAHLDKANPLTEARWVKTGEVEQWIISLGLQHGHKDQLSEWKGKIVVADPDPVSTMAAYCCSSATDSPFFLPATDDRTRSRVVDDHL